MIRLSLSALLAFATSVNSLACCMVPVTYKGTISQNAQEAVMIYDDGREELVLRINYRITGEKMPDSFAWVITVPNEPDKYAVADARLFKDMFDLAEDLLAPLTFGDRDAGMESTSEAIEEGVELGQRVQVGPYDIQPVRGIGPHALKGLNRWLKAKGFPAEKGKEMQYFVDNKFTFLCIKVMPAKEKQHVENSGMLPPLHMSFKTDRAYYPLRYSSRQGVFDLNLYVLTRKKINYRKNLLVLKKINWANRDYERNEKLRTKDMPKTLKAVLAKSAIPKKGGVWRFNNLRGKKVNRHNSIRTWEKDIFLTTN